ncbi:MAG: adenosylcobinamide-phosphate synthase CbiB [Pseudomonadota bacterium]
MLNGLSLSLAACIALLLAICLDVLWGEPAARWHPVVWMGRYLGTAGRLTLRHRPSAAFLLGACAWSAGAACVGVPAWLLQVQLGRQLLAAGGDAAVLHFIQGLLLLLLMAWILKTMFSWRMLFEETQAVEAALQQSLQAGRKRLSMLVSRDTSTLSETEVRESAIESLAENLNDSVVAPVFWFVLFGLPGAAVYRFANTADAMWGYRGLRNGVDWEWAGKWAARADDVMSWVPARITATLLLIAGGSLQINTLLSEARKTPSPNSGWPMAAMAIALGIRLGKPGVYLLNPAAREPVATDSAVAKRYACRAVLAAILLALATISMTAFPVLP